MIYQKQLQAKLVELQVCVETNLAKSACTHKLYYDTQS